MHLSANRARRTVTSLIDINALPLSQTAKQHLLHTIGQRSHAYVVIVQRAISILDFSMVCLPMSVPRVA